MHYKKRNHILLCLCIRLVQAEFAGYCECRNEPRGSAIRGEFLDQLNNGQFLNNSAPWTRQAAVCSALGICATEQDIRVQQRQTFKSVTFLHLCTSKTTDETAYIWHKTVTSSKATPVSLKSVPKKTKSKSLVTDVSAARWLQWMAREMMPQLVSLLMTTAFYRPAFLQFHGYRVQCYYSAVLLQCSVHSEKKTIIISYQTVTSRTTVLCAIALVLWRFLPPKVQSFQLHSMESQRSLWYQTFSQSFHV
jgi:hypothetical protein